ncbi:MAG TPA: 5-carboxymethyl-2-hydroxymuconate Delta-isomerase [Sphingobium sp.]
MPHLVIELSREVFDPNSAQGLLSALHDAAAGTGVVQAQDLKLRIVPIDIALVGRFDDPFVHLTFALLAGRSPEQKLALSTSMLGVLCERFPAIERCSVEIREMDAPSYKKRRSDNIPILATNLKDDPC